MSLIDEIKAQVRISDLAAQYTEVRRRGRLHVCRCLCGQNSDRNPSFTLYDDDNHFHCYACGRHGSVIDLVMLTEGVDAKAAIERLRRSYLHGRDEDRPIRVTRPDPPQRSSEITNEVIAVLEAATAHYETTLQNNTKARGYLHKRGLKDDVIAKMRIGYAGSGLGRALFEQGVELALAARIGLLAPRGESMRGRITFPVMNMQGRPVWMIGRAMETGVQPKYLGLPDGLVHKQPIVIGTPHSGVIWVEGPFDVAALVQWRLDVDYRIIGLLGTTHAQFSSLTADCPPATPHYIALDQDDAGEHAAQSMLAQLPPQHVARVRWAGAKDCGDLLMLGKQGRDSFIRSIPTCL